MTPSSPPDVAAPARPENPGADASGRARHRTPGRARIGGPQLPERVALAIALVLSVIAVVLSVQGARGAAIAVAAVGLFLAVSGLVLGWRSANLRRGSGSPTR